MRFPIIVLSFLLSAALSSAVYAHKVNMFAYQEGGQVFVDGYFADGKKAQKSEVAVYDEQGQLLLNGETDDEGMFVFTPAHKGALRITLDAGLGHKTEYKLSADEWGESADLSSSTVSDTAQAQVVISSDAKIAAHSVLLEDEKALREMIKKAVHDANTPLIRSLEEAQQKASLSDIIGGVGFIFGIFGVLLYFKARKQLKNTA